METTTCAACGMLSLADQEQHASECPLHDPATCVTCVKAGEDIDWLMRPPEVLRDAMVAYFQNAIRQLEH